MCAPQGGSPNCGDFVGSSYFGRIYFTQRDLNNDGDFVHHLVYQSRLATDRFYFGFEDLFRGGDNDFEDMMMQVTGLTPPCVPGLEVCNGRDDDCDGLVDGADPSQVCTAGALVCTGAVGPGPEVCNALDDDCDGIADNAPTDVGTSCGTSDVGVCTLGSTICVGGAPTCAGATGPSAETCNGLDDDCNGSVDDDPIDVGRTCGSAMGTCMPGVTICVDGARVLLGRDARRAGDLQRHRRRLQQHHRRHADRRGRRLREQRRRL